MIRLAAILMVVGVAAGLAGLDAGMWAGEAGLVLFIGLGITKRLRIRR